MKDEVKEILDYFVIHSTAEEFEMLSKISIYITNLQNENKNLKQINEEHRKLNGELRKTINEATEYLEYQIPQLDFEKDTKAKMLGAMVLVLLQGSDE